jgi:hypothetical protein
MSSPDQQSKRVAKWEHDMLTYLIFGFTLIIIPVLILRYKSGLVRLFIAWASGFLATILTMAALGYLLQQVLGADPASVEHAIFGPGLWMLILGPFIGMLVARGVRRRAKSSSLEQTKPDPLAPMTQLGKPKPDETTYFLG